MIFCIYVLNQIYLNKKKILANGFKEIKTSKKLRKLLELILALGNYINGEGKRGGTWGFKLDTFDKIERYKAQSDGKTTLLQYMVIHLEKTDPKLIHVSFLFSV